MIPALLREESPLLPHISRKEIAVLMLCLTVSVLSGCDIVDYFKGKGKKKDQPEKSAAVQPASQGAPSNTAAAEKPKDPNALASVGAWSITLDEFNKKLAALKESVPDFDPNAPDAKRLVLEELVRQQLLLEDAQQRGLDKKQEILDAVEEFKRTVIVQEAAKELIGNVTVSDDELKDFYEKNKQMIVSPGEWKVRMIAVADEAKAKKLLADISGGADFAETAKVNSTDPTAASGGDLGLISDVPFPQMAGALLSLEVGKVSDVFKGPNGFYIIKLEDKKGGEPLAFDNVKEEIRQNQLLSKQQQAILEYILKLEEKTKIEINENLLK